MKNRTLLLLFLCFSISANSILPWGFFAHKRINKYAVFTLPEELIGFYKKNIEYIEEHSVDADKRRYAVKEEAPRHYIDIDYYGEHPFDSMPRKWNDAVDKYSEDTLQAYGILPWHIEIIYKRLVYAFIEKDSDKILKYSADLGHYVADAHVPLHTTLNYDGQFTGQKGIHAFWESRLPELFSENYDYLVGTAQYEYSILDFAWKTVEASNNALDSVLNFDKILSETYEKDKQYSYEKRGNKTINVRSEEYSAAYHNMLSGMVERRMRKSITSIGNLWYSAWVDAGQPILDGMQNSDTPFTEEIKIDHKITKKDARGHQH
ncbi:MAG TPA: zinc dependent phospholipase C family protein [Flavobacteriales bacterium]|nr:zinc dependent phospholipase C family protein [Flavobacteriales bacterium]